MGSYWKKRQGRKQRDVFYVEKLTKYMELCYGTYDGLISCFWDWIWGETARENVMAGTGCWSPDQTVHEMLQNTWRNLMVAIQGYHGGLQLPQNLLEGQQGWMQVNQETFGVHQGQYFDADVVWTEGGRSDVPDLLFVNKNEWCDWSTAAFTPGTMRWCN